MTEVLQANIFFLITSIAVIAFTLLICVLVYQLIRIIRSVRRIVERVEEGSEVIAEDMSQLRRYFAEGSLITQIMGVFFGQKDRKNRRRKPEKKI